MGPLAMTCTSLCAIILLGIPQVGCEINEVEMNMAPFSYDDQYAGCGEQMMKESAQLLETEMGLNSDLKKEWEKAKSQWGQRKGNGTLPALPAGFTDELGIALLVYSGSFYSDLNKAVRVMGVSVQYYTDFFHFKALHFYVTTALQLLKNSSISDCQTVYRGVKNIHFMLPGINETVRFGQFTSTSLASDVAERFGNDSIFTITTCFGVSISRFVYYSHEEEVLVPTYEIFRVTDFNATENRIKLVSTKATCSNYNCVYLGGGKPDACSRSAPRAVLALSITMTSYLFSGATLLTHFVTMKIFL